MTNTQLRPPEPPIRLRPRDGEPRCIAELLAQHVWRNRLLYYIAFITTLTLTMQFTVKQ